jgi:geranylgeranyl diphosphate synthase type I
MAQVKAKTRPKTRNQKQSLAGVRTSASQKVDELFALNELNRLKTKLNRELAKYLDGKIKEARAISPDVAQLVRDSKESVLAGGKRLRGALVHYGYKAASGRLDPRIIKPAIAAELFHSSLLIHDDVMDKDEIRRGQPSFFKVYADRAQKQKHIDPLHYGYSQAIVAGDVLLSFAFDALSDTTFPQEVIIDAVKTMNDTVGIVYQGQFLDILLSHTKDATEKDVRQIHSLKTASYSFQFPLRIGAILAGASRPQLNALERYALPVGIAFQIQDDILGMFGTEEEVGKPVDTDLKEGKQTLLVIWALKNASPAQRKRLKQALGNPRAGRRMLADARSIITETGALERSMKQAEKLVAEGKSALRPNLFHPDAIKFLHTLADLAIKRRQ